MLDQAKLAMKRKEAILEIINGIYRVAMRNPDCKELLVQACKFFCEEGGYQGAWVLLVDKSGRPVSCVRETAGPTACMNNDMLQQPFLPKCAQRALENGGPVTVTHPALFCSACSIPDSRPPVQIHCMPLVYSGTKHGVLAVSSQPGGQLSDEEKRLLELAAEALAFSINIIDMLKKPDEAEARRRSLKKLLDTMHEGAALHEIIRDPEGKPIDYRILDANPAYKKHTGIDVTMAIGARGSELYRMARPPGLDAFTRVSETGEPAHFEIDHEPSGRMFRVSAFALKSLVGAVFEDITAAKATQTILAENEAKYRVLVENTNDIPFSADSDGIMTYIGPQASAYGFDPLEIVSRPFTNFVLPEDRQNMLDSFRETMATGSEEPADFRVPDKTGRIRWMESRSKLIKDADGKPVGISGVLRDITDRKEAEQALAESEAKYRTLVENTDDIVYMIDPEGQLTYISQQIERYGLKTDDLLRTHFLESIHPEDKEMVKKDFEEGTLTGRESATEFRLIAPGVETLWLEERGSFIRDESGRITSRSGVLRDVTDRRRAEEALKRSEEQNRAMLQTLPDILILMNGQGRCMEIHSPDTSELLINREKLINRTVQDVLPAALAEQFQNAVTETLQTGQVQSLEFSLGVKAGLRFYEARMVRAGENLVLTLIRNITEHRQGELALRESETRFRSIFENAGAGIAIMSTTSHFLHANRAFCEMLGYSEDELKKLSCTELTHPEDLESTYNVMKQIQDGADVAQFEKRLIDKRGDIVWIAANASVVRDVEGNPLYLIANFQNETHRTLAEREKEKLQAQLLQSQKMEVVGRMAGGMAHDFNNLLTPIMGYSEIVLARLPKDDPLFPKIGLIRSAAERAATLTKQLLTFSRKQILEIKSFNLNETISDCTNLLERLIGEDIEIQIRLEPSLGPAMGDPSQIQQALMNLVINARDAMPNGGKLTIETANTTLTNKEAARHAGVAPGPHVMMSVADTGIGMSPEAMKHLFEPFFTTKARGKGTGLGLSTIYGIVRQHQGAVEVHSEPGIGTSFTVLIPQARQPYAKPVYEAHEIQGKIADATILVVEDELMVRTLTSEILSSNGYRVLSASNGEEALQLLSGLKDQVHLLLTDVIMPRMNGKELHARVLAVRPGIRVLFMSGYTDNVITDQGLLEPGAHFLEKPFDTKALLRKVAVALA